MRSPAIALAFSGLLVLVACPKPGEVGAPCDSSKPCAAGQRCNDGKCVAGNEDAGPVQSVTPSCGYDTDCPAGQICDDATHLCAAGLDCSQNATICGFCDEGAVDCVFAVAEAFCDPNAAVCRRVHTSCQPCHGPLECTPSSAVSQNHCVPYADGSFCAVDCAGGQSCPRGFSCDGTACMLEPTLGRCSDAPACTKETETACPTATYCTTRDFPGKPGVCLATCLDDEDCRSPKVCRRDPGPRFGTCIDGCAPVGTAVGAQVCHATGRPGSYCAADSDCLAITGLGGFECTELAGHCSTTSCHGWCTAAGCQTSAECPLPRTYCDSADSSCKEGCALDGDCGAFELCEVATHTCHTQPCRGKELSCNMRQWCCGKELFDGAAAPEHQSCPAGVEMGACFDMADPYCRRCEDDNGCADIDTFGYASHCYELKTQDRDGNEVSLGKFCSVGCETSDDCPRGIACQQELPEQGGGTIKGCIDARCASAPAQ